MQGTQPLGKYKSAQLYSGTGLYRIKKRNDLGKKVISTV